MIKTSALSVKVDSTWNDNIENYLKMKDFNCLVGLIYVSI